MLFLVFFSVQFQMVQFVAIFIHQFQLLFRECDYPNYFMIWIGLHGAMFLFLFSDFYKTKYTAKTSKASLRNGTKNGTANGVSISIFQHFINIRWWFGNKKKTFCFWDEISHLGRYSQNAHTFIFILSYL